MPEPLRIRFVPGVTPGKWLRTWEERMPHSPLDASPVEVRAQREVLLEGGADMCFVRLPLDREGLHVIPLYREVPVVVAAKDHPVAAFDEVDIADLDGENLLDAAELGDQTAVAVAASGAGLVLVPLSVARLHHRKDAVHRPVTGVPSSEIGLAWLVDNDDPRLETFIGVVRGRTPRSTRGRDEAGPPDGAGRRGGSGGRGGTGSGRGGTRRGPGGRGSRGGGRPGHRRP